MAKIRATMTVETPRRTKVAVFVLEMNDGRFSVYRNDDNELHDGCIEYVTSDIIDAMTRAGKEIGVIAIDNA